MEEIKKYLTPPAVFVAEASLESAEMVIMGLPWDCTSSWQAGSRFGPQAIRQAFAGIESWSPYCRRDLADMAIHDAGDLELPFGDTEGTLAIVRRAAGGLIGANKKVVAPGGEHLLALPLVQAYHDKYGDELHVLHLDAHCDLREDFLGVRLSHATVMRRVEEVVGKERLSHFFLRSGDREEWRHLEAAPHKHGLGYPCGTETIEGMDLSYLSGKKLYITLDLDVFDPAVLPGTGVSDAGGITFADFMGLLDKLRGYDIIGCDILELCPPADPSGNSALTSCKIMRELMLSMG